MFKRTRINTCALLALGSALMFSAPVFAQGSEGSLSGQAAGGTAVTIVNVETGQSRQSQSDRDGNFTFSKLPPGTYRVSAGGVTREVAVGIGSGSQVSLLADSQRIEVTGSRVRSSIDVSSVESNSVFTQEQIRALPVARSVDAVALLAPGTVKGDNFGLGLTLPSFGGASIAENGYYINGFDVTNIRNFLSYAEIPFDAIGQQQVKSGGYGAEYGRSLGGVVSIVTKRGTNEWKGGVGMYFEPESLRSRGTDVADREPDRAGLPYVFNSADTSQFWTGTAYVGGPIIKDKLFVYGLIEARNNTESTFNQSDSTKRENNQPSGMVKLDWSITDNHLLEYTGIYGKKKYTYKDYTSVPDYSPTHTGTPGLSESTAGGNVNILKYTGTLTDNLTVSALYGTVDEKREKFTGARTLNQDCPVVLETNLADIGCWIGPFPGLGAPDPLAPDDKDSRKAFRLDLEYVLGNHTIRAGLDNQEFKSSEAGGSTYTGGAYFRYFNAPTTGPGTGATVNGVPNAVPFGSQYVRKRILGATSGTYEVDNSALYIEDSWKVAKNVLLYGGLRWESFNNKNGDGTSFVKADNLLAPRLGFAWDVNNDSSLKVFGNLGRYYIPVASNTNIRSTRAEIFTHQFYQFNGRDPRTQAPLNLSAQIGDTVLLSDGRLADPGTIADTQLKPMNQDELILGLQKALTRELTAGAKVTYRKINAGMDDYCDTTRIATWIQDNVNPAFDEGSLAPCMLMNPGKPLSIKIDKDGDGKLVTQEIPASALGLAKYERTYKALELTLERPFDGKWSLQGSYVWSKSQGTAEGYVQSNLNQDDAGVTQDFDFGSFSDGAKGYLPNDRTHVFKLFGNYQINEDFRLGFNFTRASGRPLSCIGFVPTTVPDYEGASVYSSASSYYCITDTSKEAVLVQRGSVGRTPWISKLDLSLAYVPQWQKRALTLQVDVFNLMNSQKATELNETRDFSRATPFQQNLNYLSPTSFQEPRYVRLTARYEF